MRERDGGFLTADWAGHDDGVERSGCVGTRSREIVFGNLVKADAVFQPEGCGAFEWCGELEGIVFAGLIAGYEGHFVPVQCILDANFRDAFGEGDLCFGPEGSWSAHGEACKDGAGFFGNSNAEPGGGQARRRAGFRPGSSGEASWRLCRRSNPPAPGSTSYPTGW